MEISEHKGMVGGIEAHWREAPGPEGQAAPILYLHGVPTASWEWEPFLARTGGVAPDLPGFGESGKTADFDYSIAGYERWLGAFADAVGLERFSLVVQDWGAVGLAFAQSHPERIERLVVHVSVPFLPGYHWHWIARMWRRPVIGELFQGFSTKLALRQVSKQANYTEGPLPKWFIDRLWKDNDHGTQRAILKLYRSAPEEVLARAGRRLGDVDCPALVLWPTEDPYVPAEFGQAYADALGGEVRLEMLERAGHWPWLDRPEVVERTAGFLISD